MEKIAVSACLVGKNTKYNGSNNYNEFVIEYLKDKNYILICPEVLGGLNTPRKPSERIGNKVINIDNIDVTKNFYDGAKIALDTLLKENITSVIVKSNSPSCGYKKIYDGSFSNNLIDGNGVFVEIVLKYNIKVYTEKDIEELIKQKVLNL